MRAHLCVRVFVLEDPDSPSLVYEARGGTTCSSCLWAICSCESRLDFSLLYTRENKLREARARPLSVAKSAPDAARISAPPRSISSKDTVRVDIQHGQERGIAIVWAAKHRQDTDLVVEFYCRVLLRVLCNGE